MLCDNEATCLLRVNADYLNNFLGGERVHNVVNSFVNTARPGRHSKLLTYLLNKEGPKKDTWGTP